jgi:predicted nucleic acid-binding protein
MDNRKLILYISKYLFQPKERPESVLNKLRSFTPSDLCISSTTMAELEYGIAKSTRPDQNRLSLSLFLSGIETLPFDEKAAREQMNWTHFVRALGDLSDIELFSGKKHPSLPDSFSDWLHYRLR